MYRNSANLNSEGTGIGTNLRSVGRGIGTDLRYK